MNLERKLSEKLIKQSLVWKTTVCDPSKLLENKKYITTRFYDARTLYSIRKKLQEEFPRLFYNGFRNHKPYITDCTLEISQSAGIHTDSLTNRKTYIEPRKIIKQDVWVGAKYEGKQEVTSCFCFSSMEDAYTPQTIVPCMNTNYYGLKMREIITIENSLVSMPAKTWNFLKESKIPFVTLENILEKVKDCTHLIYNYNFVWRDGMGYWDIFREPYEDSWKKKTVDYSD